MFSETPIRKQPLSFLWALALLSISVILSGCPYHSVYYLDPLPKEPIDEAWVGRWQGVVTDEVYGTRTLVDVDMTRSDELTYEIRFSGFFGRINKKRQPQRDTLMASAFISRVGDHTVLNVLSDETVFLVEVTYQEDRLSFLPLSDRFTSFIVKSDVQLRQLLAQHYRTRLFPAYDESFCLRNMTRMPPAPSVP